MLPPPPPAPPPAPLHRGSRARRSAARSAYGTSRSRRGPGSPRAPPWPGTAGREAAGVGGGGEGGGTTTRLAGRCVCGGMREGAEPGRARPPRGRQTMPGLRRPAARSPFHAGARGGGHGDAQGPAWAWATGRGGGPGEEGGRGGERGAEGPGGAEGRPRPTPSVGPHGHLLSTHNTPLPIPSGGLEPVAGVSGCPSLAALPAAWPGVCVCGGELGWGCPLWRGPRRGAGRLAPRLAAALGPAYEGLCTPRRAGHPTPSVAKPSVGSPPACPDLPRPHRCCPHSTCPQSQGGQGLSPQAGGAGVPLTPPSTFRRSRRPSSAGHSHRGFFVLFVCFTFLEAVGLCWCVRPSREGPF